MIHPIHRYLALLAVAVYATATLTPCAPVARAGASDRAPHTAAHSDADHHDSRATADHHEHAAAAHTPSHPRHDAAAVRASASERAHHAGGAATASSEGDRASKIAGIAAPCPCGCGERADAGLGGKRLGPALPNTATPPLVDSIALRSPADAAAFCLLPLRLPDPVPLAA